MARAFPETPYAMQQAEDIGWEMKPPASKLSNAFSMRVCLSTLEMASDGRL